MASTEALLPFGCLLIFLLEIQWLDLDLSLLFYSGWISILAVSTGCIDKICSSIFEATGFKTKKLDKSRGFFSFISLLGFVFAYTLTESD